MWRRSWASDGGADVYHSCIVQIIRQSSFSATPWRNGGGVTHEAIRVPATGDSFRWRVSVAHIDASGPFSDFAGYDRTMVLLRGAGVTLKFAAEQRILRHIGELAEFDGAVSTYCELLAGPCVDLNLMVSKSARAQVRVERLVNEIVVQASPLESTVIFGIEDPLLLKSNTGETQRLEPWDLAVLSRCGARVRKIQPGNLSAPSAVFFATIGS